MRQDGVEVRPIRQVTGGAEFNEVFLGGAVAPDDHRLGDVNGGWRVLQAALGFERLIMGSQGQDRKPRGEPTHEQVLAARRSPWTRKVGGADYVELARERGRGDDPVVRQQVARLHTLEQVNRWNGMRARVEARDGDPSLMSLGKLAMSRIVHTGVEITTELLGAESVLDGDASPVAAEVNRSAFAAYVTSIGGGTDQIQRNIIGERLLGLPKEPELDRDVPFRDVRKAQAVRSFN
jgi:alkylation response protein AidB-like acyl-CoA dehydrogenase